MLKYICFRECNLSDKAHRGGKLTASIYMQSKRPSLSGLLEGCKQFALNDYKQNGRQRSVLDNFISSVFDACIVADAQDLFVPSVHSKLYNIKLDSLESFEAGIDEAIGHLKETAGL